MLWACQIIRKWHFGWRGQSCLKSKHTAKSLQPEQICRVYEPCGGLRQSPREGDSSLPLVKWEWTKIRNETFAYYVLFLFFKSSPACLYSQYHHDLVDKVMGWIFFSYSFVQLHHTLGSWLLILQPGGWSCALCMTKQAKLERQGFLLVSQEAHLSACPSGANRQDINRSQIAWIIICTVMFYSSHSNWALTPLGR